MADNFQRTGSLSNAHVGREFEQIARKVLIDAGLQVSADQSVDVGIGVKQKRHVFDLGSENPPVIVECKSHKWTKGHNVPSAKLTVWNEAMYYFNCAPAGYRKIFFVLRDKRGSTGETLASYYLRTYLHLVPEDVEIWEYDETNASYEVVHGAQYDGN